MVQTLHIYVSGYARQNNGQSGLGICYHAHPESDPFFEETAYMEAETQNSAVYQAIKKALINAADWGFKKTVIYTDNRLVAGQMTENMSVRANNIQPLYEETKNRFGDFDQVEIKYVDKGINRRAREMAKAASLAGPEKVTAQAIQWEVKPGITGLVLAFTPKLMICQFNYKKGAKIDPHKHSNEQGSYVVRGSLKYVVADQDIVMGPGSGLVVSGNAEHSIEALQDTLEIVTYAPMRWDLVPSQ